MILAEQADRVVDVAGSAEVGDPGVLSDAARQRGKDRQRRAGEKIPRGAVETLVLLLAPFAPHICEELWSILGHEASLAYAPWPGFEAGLALDPRLEYAVQINGKLRHKVGADAASHDTPILDIVKADAKVASLLQGKIVRKEIVVPGRLVNFIVEDAPG